MSLGSRHDDRAGLLLTSQDIDLVDAHAGRVERADAILVFGTEHWSPAELAASLYFDGFAPAIVTTGGADRHPRNRSEGAQHRHLLIAAGVPHDAILTETTSTTTVENVEYALPLLAELGEVRTLIAVVKWFHRRALVTLAESAPTLERIYAADYEPFNRSTRSGLSRATWQESCPRSVAKEVECLRRMERAGADLLRRTDRGWVRTRT